MSCRAAASGPAAALAALANLTAWLRPEAGLTVVTPLVRALVLISAFAPQERWLGNSQLAHRTGLPPSTVTRITRTLVHLGYLLVNEQERKYRLAPAVLALGYAAIAHSTVQRLAGKHMAAIAQQYQTHLCLATRDRLELVVLECRPSPELPLALPLDVGMRVDLAESPMGWSLLAALPQLERRYLLENVERRALHGWPRQRRRICEGLAQVAETGYCSAVGEWESKMAILAAPVLLEGTSPFVLACIGAGARMSRRSVERELGPRLLQATRDLQDEFNSIGR